ncbi:MAG: MerR family transcriptional regulator [Nitrospina sp.]|nr:MerR family transcriptional regulator [Nitrospina sp.]
MNQKIPDKLFFKIGEVAKLTGVEQHVLRYWEDEFEVLQPKKNKSGQRFYEKKDIELIFKIQRLLYLERYTIAGAKQKMKASKKKNSQLSLGFDRESYLEQKRDIISDLESILELLPED